MPIDWPIVWTGDFAGLTLRGRLSTVRVPAGSRFGRGSRDWLKSTRLPQQKMYADSVYTGWYRNLPAPHPADRDYAHNLGHLLRHYDRPRGTFRSWYSLATFDPPVPGYILCEVVDADGRCWIDSATACQVIETLRRAGAVERVEWQPAPVQQVYGLAGMDPPGLTGRPVKPAEDECFHTAWSWRALGPWPVERLRAK